MLRLDWLLATAPDRSQPIQRTAARDGEQPRLHGSSLPGEPPRLAPRLPEHLFDNVFDIVRGREHAMHHRVDHGKPAIVERAERTLVARLHSCNQIDVDARIARLDTGRLRRL